MVNDFLPKQESKLFRIVWRSDHNPSILVILPLVSEGRLLVYSFASR